MFSFRPARKLPSTPSAVQGNIPHPSQIRSRYPPEFEQPFPNSWVLRVLKDLQSHFLSLLKWLATVWGLFPLSNQNRVFMISCVFPVKDILMPVPVIPHSTPPILLQTCLQLYSPRFSCQKLVLNGVFLPHILSASSAHMYISGTPHHLLTSQVHKSCNCKTSRRTATLSQEISGRRYPQGILHWISYRSPFSHNSRNNKFCLVTFSYRLS